MLKTDLEMARDFLNVLVNDAGRHPYVTLSKKFPKKAGGLFKKSEILSLASPDIRLRLAFLKVKPVRTLSGVTSVTILTKPYPCPGRCLFCPVDVRMPKSYLSTEPGAQRADACFFDPYLQTYNRLQSLKDMGHPYQKIELIILGGTWSNYPISYRRWFIKRAFEALNDFGDSKDQRSFIDPHFARLSLPLKPVSHSQALMTLPLKGKTYNQSIKDLYGIEVVPGETASWSEVFTAHRLNESGHVRCIGLVLETRPDYVTAKEVENLRLLGATKIQLGLQSLSDRVLSLNLRGHTVAHSILALAQLRQAGFKLHVHWMPNLYGSDPQKDMAEYVKLFSNHNFRPDEIKIYPCSLLPGTGLMDKYHSGSWRPYSKVELTAVLSFCLTHTPRYCRISRMVRDIRSADIVIGNKHTNFRQIAQSHVVKKDGIMSDLRAREIRGELFDFRKLKFKSTRYLTSVATEYFLEYVTSKDRLVAFLRLSLPINHFHPELLGSAMIREVHVYGQAVDLREKPLGPAQHLGLGKQLIHKALKKSKTSGYRSVAVISAVGTREYYRRLGFQAGRLYQFYLL